MFVVCVCVFEDVLVMSEVQCEEDFCLIDVLVMLVVMMCDRDLLELLVMDEMSVVVEVLVCVLVSDGDANEEGEGEGEDGDDDLRRVYE